MTKKRILVTGGLGFIGSYFVKLALESGYHVINVDKKTYAARKDLDFEKNENYEFIHDDICKLSHLPPEIDAIVNFAAESHVDNSITVNEVFFESNVRGVYNLLELIRAKEKMDRPVLLHISTDEVYGTYMEGQAKETDVLNPSVPYSATKAAADQLILAWSFTYDIDYFICRSCNNYGWGQYPEKLFAKTVDHLARGKKMTIHGDGSYSREWLYAEDNCKAILAVLEKGKKREIYNISSNDEHNVIEVVNMIMKEMKKNPDEYIEFIPNRWGQDRRYSVNTDKIRALGWSPTIKIEDYVPTYIDLYNKSQK